MESTPGIYALRQSGKAPVPFLLVSVSSNAGWVAWFNGSPQDLELSIEERSLIGLDIVSPAFVGWRPNREVLAIADYFLKAIALSLNAITNPEQAEVDLLKGLTEETTLKLLLAVQQLAEYKRSLLVPPLVI